MFKSQSQLYQHLTKTTLFLKTVRCLGCRKDTGSYNIDYFRKYNMLKYDDIELFSCII